MNKNHDPKNGQFSSGGGSSANLGTARGTALSRARAASKEFAAKHYPKAAHDGGNWNGDQRAAAAPTTYVHHGSGMRMGEVIPNAAEHLAKHSSQMKFGKAYLRAKKEGR